MRGGYYAGTFKPYRPRHVPKKLLYHKRIKITEKYSFMASGWIPNTPQSDSKGKPNFIA
jgi:hypothetical protein